MSTPRTPPRLPGFDYSSVRTYFITFCVEDRQPVFARPSSAQTAQQVIFEWRVSSYWINAYCIMPDHIHLLITLRPSLHLSRLISGVKKQIRHRVPCKFRWQRGYHDHIVREYENIVEFARYIVKNPVRAGLVTPEQAYPFAGIVDPIC